ncbi:MAG TPA: hypothetical protein VFI08_11915 [Spirochaetia bacterium]|nr:hypothetical protein [Spirochaetia bacterium]
MTSELQRSTTAGHAPRTAVAGFLVCRTCGRYVTAAQVVSRAYCSEECTHSYESCANCGRYYPAGSGFDRGACSRECTVRYQIYRTYGPEPVTVVTEV